jgi:hypothetical protein
MNRLIVATAILGSLATPADAGLLDSWLGVDKDTKAVLMPMLRASCIQEANAAATTPLPPWPIYNYCNCAADHALSAVTKADVNYLMAHGKQPDGYYERIIVPAIMACIKHAK